ncbi:hypothetical protein MNBD_GAMMA12-1983 [hydrothermal vent metagenome]|uniref:Nitroreductase domain-containing protein n=1 Tax=hydrothermal vent metagenome TaxID=652676 RepID=A0A3B0ZKX7_9ZZZZ
MIGQIMQGRRSVRKFTDEKPSRELLVELIDYAITAPSASNNQPWRFLIIEDKRTINSLAGHVQTSVDNIAENISEPFIESFKAYGDYFTRFTHAPILIIPLFKEMKILSQLLNEDSVDNANVNVLEFNSGIVSTSLAIQNLLLYAHSKGLGASCMTGPLVAADKIRIALKIPTAWNISCFIAVGYPDETPEPKPRKSSDSVIRWVSIKEE